MSGEHLIFLISQPRSGSSMLQQLLMAHPQIASTPESWQMLSLVSTYKISERLEGHNPKFATVNFNEFLKNTSEGLEGYKEKIRAMALHYFEEKKGDALYFLDKTPRNYHILPELMELFPKAKFIFLIRNPLSVFASILDYNFKGNLEAFLQRSDRLDDLFLAPSTLNKSATASGDIKVVTYEELISEPNASLEQIFDFLGLIPLEENTYNLNQDFEASGASDLKSLHRHNKPVDDYLEAWKQPLDTTQKKKVALEYLSKLRSAHPDYFEYDWTGIIENLKRHSPKRRTRFNLGFDDLAKAEEKMSILGILKKRIYHRLQPKS